MGSRATSTEVDRGFLTARLGRWAGREGALFQQLASRITELVDAGELRPGDRLPAERGMAEALNVSRGTVVAAYDLLREREVVSRRQGSGTRVCGVGPAVPAETSAAEALFASSPDSIDMLRASPPIAPRMIELLDELSLTGDLAALNSFEPSGLPELRAAIAAHHTGEGLPTSPGQVLVTNGAQQGLSLTIGLFTRPGDNVITEETTWPGFTDLARQRGTRVHGLPMGPDGMDLDVLAQWLPRLRPAAMVFNPHNHNPTGTRLPPAGRERLVRLAREHDVLLVEDRVAAPLSFDGVTAPPLAALDERAPVITVDSIGKVAWEQLRMGWVRAQPAVIDRLRARRAVNDLTPPAPSQLIALAALAEWESLRAQRVHDLRERCDVVRAELASQLPEWRAARPRGGLSLWAQLPGPDATRFAEFATRFGVSVAGGREFAISGSCEDRIRIPFCEPPEVLREALRRLGAAWAAFPG